MAKYIGSLTTDARGKHAGTVFTRAVNGTNLKAHAVPLQTGSTYQRSLRSNFAAAASAWRTLTDSNRQTWYLVAAAITWYNSLAQPYSPTGQQMYVQAFVTAALCGATPPDSSPTSPPSVLPIIGCGAGTVAGVFSVGASGPGGAPYTGAWTVSLSSIIRPTQNYILGLRRRPMGFLNTGYLLDATAAWRAAYGALPTPGSTIAYRAVPFDPTSYITGSVVNGTLVSS